MPHAAGDAVIARTQLSEPKPRLVTNAPSGPACDSVATIVAGEADDAARLIARVRAAIPRGMTPLVVFLFGRRDSLDDARAQLARHVDGRAWPALMVEGR